MAEITRKLNKLGLTQVWSKITELFATKTELTEAIEGIASSDEIESTITTAVANKADKATTLSGYGITDAMTSEETTAAISEAVNAAVVGIYKIKGSTTFGELPTDNMEEGWVYNITEAFVTTDAFVEGSGANYPAGTNVVYTENGWDCLPGIYDFSDYLKADDIVDITEDEINQICVLPTSGE